MYDKKTYYNIFSEFNNINKFREMKAVCHHGNNRFDHISRVAKLSFIISKKLGLDYISCTRGAMMHDFFTIDDISRSDYKYGKFLKSHPIEALNNSLNYFDVNNIEEDIILTHMYPITKDKPAFAESKIVCISDKIVSLYEFLRYRLKILVCLALIFCHRFIC